MCLYNKGVPVPMIQSSKNPQLISRPQHVGRVQVFGSRRDPIGRQWPCLYAYSVHSFSSFPLTNRDSQATSELQA